MSTKFQLGKGTIFSISSDGTTFTPVKQLKTIQFSGSKSDTEDITNMDSTGAFREYVPTLLDAGQVAISGVSAPNDPGQIMCSSAWTGQTLLQCKLQFPVMPGYSTGFLRTFSGYVVEAGGIDAQFDKATTFNATIKITGAWTDTAATVSGS